MREEPQGQDDGPLVLVADDDKDVCYLLGLMLTDAGYRVQEAHSLAGVQERLGARPLPDLVVLDVKLGTEDATMLLGDLRASARTQTLPVLLISARVNVATMVRDTHTASLAKPFGTRQLLSAVAQALG